MSVAPGSTPVDQGGTGLAVDGYSDDLGYQEAAAWTLLDAQDGQHSLMTAWGNPPHFASLYAVAGGTVFLPFLCTPGVTECNLHFLVSGEGTVSVSVATYDATGTELTWQDTGADDVTATTIVSTVGVVDGGAANTGRAVTVDSPVNWLTAVRTMSISVNSSGSGTVWGVMIEPIHEVR